MNDDSTNIAVQGSHALSGSETLGYWLSMLQGREADPRLWWLLDDDLRLALAQTYLLLTSARADDQKAAALAARDSGEPQFDAMIAQFAQHWRHNFALLLPGFTAPYRAMTAGADMEIYIVHSSRRISSPGAPDSPAAFTFLTRSTWEYGSVIAATGSRLPVPGWPPTEWTIPQLRAKPA